MDEIDRRVIQVYIDTLAQETNFSSLLRKLSEDKNIITHNLKNKYKELQKKGKTSDFLNRELYKDIQTRGKTAFNFLIRSLKEVHPHLAELLLPNERVTTSLQREVPALSENEAELTEYQGICTLISEEQSNSDLRSAVQKLCYSIKAKFVTDERNLTQANFHLAIKEGKFDENVINDVESLYRNHLNLRIIILNIINREVTDSEVVQHTKANNKRSSAAFIVDIHIHQGDHLPSVIDIIRKIVVNNPGYEIRDIFRMVMEKMAKWCCRLNTESRSFPEFYF